MGHFLSNDRPVIQVPSARHSLIGSAACAAALVFSALSGAASSSERTDALATLI